MLPLELSLQTLMRMRPAAGIVVKAASLALSFVLMAASCPVWSDEAEADPRLEQSRALASEFAGELTRALTDALQQGGPTAAIFACRDLAPGIASRLSRTTGARVARTSRRYRNPLNAPESWQKEVLESFEAQLQSRSESPMETSPGKLPEFYAADEEGARFMKAIPLGPLCATCHGMSVAPEISEALAIEYPHDLATGYRIGALRGAFSIVWPSP